VEQTVLKMVTDPQKIKKGDPGRPEICNVFTYHTLFSDGEEIAQVDRDCRTGAQGCVECKRRMAKNLNSRLEPIREKRSRLLKKAGRMDDILSEGSAAARKVARKTMAEVQEAMKINPSTDTI
jgi:tryptophanyl-tRNA synthetase